MILKTAHLLLHAMDALLELLRHGVLCLLHVDQVVHKHYQLELIEQRKKVACRLNKLPTHDVHHIARSALAL